MTSGASTLTRLAARLLPPVGPGRILVGNSAISSLGNGLYVSGSAIYYVRVLGLSATEVGSALTAGAALALATSIPIGRWCDRVGSRRAAIAMAVLKGALLVVAALVTAVPLVLATIVALAVVEAGGSTARGSLISAVMGPEGRVKLSAYLRVVFNVGFTLGVTGAGIALAIDTRIAYQSLFWLAACAMAGIVAGYLRLPATAPSPPETRPHRVVDLPYLAVAQVAGLARIGPIVLAVGIPLWLVEHTSAPRPLAAWLTVINTALVVALQVIATRGADTVPGAAQLQRRAFWVMAAGAIVVGLSGLGGPWTAGVLLGLAVVLLTLGEILGEGGRWGLRYELAPDHAQGTYGGLFTTGETLTAAAGPLLVTAVPEHFGAAGWGVVAGVFVVSSWLGSGAVRWAQRTRAPVPDRSPSHAHLEP